MSSDLPGNPYADNAAVDMTAITAMDAVDTTNVLLEANGYATLAVAHEQRTANLIALLACGFETVQIQGVDYGKLADTIKERLDL